MPSARRLTLNPDELAAIAIIATFGIVREDRSRRIALVDGAWRGSGLGRRGQWRRRAFRSDSLELDCLPPCLVPKERGISLDVLRSSQQCSNGLAQVQRWELEIE